MWCVRISYLKGKGRLTEKNCQCCEKLDCTEGNCMCVIMDSHRKIVNIVGGLAQANYYCSQGCVRALRIRDAISFFFEEER